MLWACSQAYVCSSFSFWIRFVTQLRKNTAKVNSRFEKSSQTVCFIHCRKCFVKTHRRTENSVNPTKNILSFSGHRSNAIRVISYVAGKFKNTRPAWRFSRHPLCPFEITKQMFREYSMNEYYSYPACLYLDWHVWEIVSLGLISQQFKLIDLCLNYALKAFQNLLSLDDQTLQKDPHYLQSQQSLPWMACLCNWQRSFLQAETSSLLPQQILSFYWRNRTSFHLPIQWYTNLQNADEKQAWIRVGVMNETTVTASLRTANWSRTTYKRF